MLYFTYKKEIKNIFMFKNIEVSIMVDAKKTGIKLSNKAKWGAIIIVIIAIIIIAWLLV